MSEKGPLPDTVPIPSAHRKLHAVEGEIKCAIDFSETASTGRRSSPCLASTECGADVWDLSDIGSDHAGSLKITPAENEKPDETTPNETHNGPSLANPSRSKDKNGRTMQTRSMAHAQEKLHQLPLREEEPESRLLHEVEQESRRPVTTSCKSSKPKQAPKEPLQFDETTKVIESPRAAGAPHLHASPMTTSINEITSVSNGTCTGSLQAKPTLKPCGQPLYTYGKQNTPQRISATVQLRALVMDEAPKSIKAAEVSRPSPLRAVVGVDMAVTPLRDDTAISPAVATNEAESIDDISSPITTPDPQTVSKAIKIRTESQNATGLRHAPEKSPSCASTPARVQTQVPVSRGSESPKSHISCSTFPSHFDLFSQDLLNVNFAKHDGTQLSAVPTPSKPALGRSNYEVPILQGQPGPEQPGTESLILGGNDSQSKHPRRMSVSETGSPMSHHVLAPGRHHTAFQHHDVNDTIGDKTSKILKTRSIYGPDPFRSRESHKIMRRPSSLEYTCAPANKSGNQGQKQPSRLVSDTSEKVPIQSYRTLRSRMNGAAAGVSEPPRQPLVTPSRLETELGQFTQVSCTRHWLG